MKNTTRGSKFENWHSYRKQYAAGLSNVLHNAPSSQEKLRKKMMKHFGVGSVYFGDMIIDSMGLEVKEKNGNHVIFQNGDPNYVLETFYDKNRGWYEMKDVKFNRDKVVGEFLEGICSFWIDYNRSRNSMHSRPSSEDSAIGDDVEKLKKFGRKFSEKFKEALNFRYSIDDYLK